MALGEAGLFLCGHHSVSIVWWKQGDWDYSLYLDYPDSSPTGLPIPDDFFTQAAGSTAAYQAAAGKVS